jgi:ribonuclease E
MLINVLQPEESRIAIVEGGRLEELYVERTSAENYVGNIYKGRVVNLEPSIQAAFVDFGVGRNGFLHVSDVEWEYYKHLVDANDREDLDDEDDDDPDPDDAGNGNGSRPGRTRTRQTRGNERSTRNKPPIQNIFQRGSEVLVQVIKEGLGTKGPTLSTYISIPGRYLVLMPGLQRVGVSRKIEDETVRRKLRQSMRDLNPPEGLGFIIRTAGIDRTKSDLKRDLEYLVRLWKTLVDRLEKSTGPQEIYAESDMIIRTIRDIYTGEIETIWIDQEEAYQRAREFMRIVLPAHVDRIRLYDGNEPIFTKYGIEDEIAKIQKRTLPLKGGGSIVIEQTEALVAIDVNSGSFRVDDDAEQTAYQVNLRAAEEICRQLRLRDLGGVIVNDFIDMREEKHRRAVERKMRELVERDRARTKILRISPFGLIEMTRQRIRPSLRRSTYEECPCCHGTGHVKTDESVAIEVMRLLMTAANNDQVTRLDLEVHERVSNYLNNRKRKDITRLEDQRNVNVIVLPRTDVNPEHVRIRGRSENGHEVLMLPVEGSQSR